MCLFECLLLGSFACLFVCVFGSLFVCAFLRFRAHSCV